MTKFRQAVSQEQYERIKILIELNRTDAEIAVMLNLSKSVIWRIRQGKWRPASQPVKKDPEPEFASDRDEDEEKSREYKRCPGCGNKVLMPCLLCRTNAYKAREKKAAERQGCPS